ncbi:MAG TPA: hypothetical protein DER56_00960 [Thermosipho africanus]|jgi:hypothetical protein|uniref:hypothetical protein n=1 Tax=Thermosipho sp. (in: thermotogales) TaxID=1968895 RepID=UPI000EDF5636|nr:hypothetical protein [Thermosipho sp. (in: thermotogales)]MBZ4649706.1 hypothetical protein [Thermosipho sp. (in: thermotogales)]MDK2839209.1 hypothetical protein [Thermosipho sp. (in: thermotogales)]MDK2900392.1 hypothetical protein [Thermosipho sp. (in: thermotogales)]HCF37639.1 hypothetical protein [Thermosipho africanus]
MNNKLKWIVITISLTLTIISMFTVTLFSKGIIQYSWILKVPGRISGGQFIPGMEKLYFKLFLSFLFNTLAILTLSTLFSKFNNKITDEISLVLGITFLFVSLLSFYNIFQLIAFLFSLLLLYFIFSKR